MSVRLEHLLRPLPRRLTLREIGPLLAKVTLHKVTLQRCQSQFTPSDFTQPRVQGLGSWVEGIGGRVTAALRCSSDPGGESVERSIQEQLLGRNVQRFRGGLASEAHRLLLNSRLES